MPTRPRAAARAPRVAPPFIRRPKPLDDEPTLFLPADGGGAGPVLGGRSKSSNGPPRAPGQAGPDAKTGDLTGRAGDGPVSDLAVHAAARAIAARLAIPRPRRRRHIRSAAGALVSAPHRDQADELDLERTLEVLAEHPWPRDDELIVRAPMSARRSVVLAVDVSGSMRGERVRNAAATIGAVAGELARERLCVIAFWSDAALLLRFGAPIRPLQLIDDLLGVPARGLTNVAFPLEIAARELRRARDARVLLLSDCVHNAGPDPRRLAARLPRVDVLLDVTGHCDSALAQELARLGRGRLRPVRGHHDVAPALRDIFAD